MKKIIKRFIAVAIAAILLSLPTATTVLAANSAPVLEFDFPENHTKGYRYQPIPYTLAPNDITFIADVVEDGYWKVPQNMMFTIYANFVSSGTFTVEVIEVPSGDIVYTSVESNGAFYLSIPAKSTSANYFVRLTNIGNNTINIVDYSAACFN